MTGRCKECKTWTKLLSEYRGVRLETPICIVCADKAIKEAIKNKTIDDPFGDQRA